MCRGWSLVALVSSFTSRRARRCSPQSDQGPSEPTFTCFATHLPSILIFQRPDKVLHQPNASYNLPHIAAVEQCSTSHGTTLRRLRLSSLKIQVPNLRAEILLHRMLQTTQSSTRSRSATQSSKISWECASQTRPPGNHPADSKAGLVDSCFGSRVQASVDALSDSARSTRRNVRSHSGSWTG